MRKALIVSNKISNYCEKIGYVIALILFATILLAIGAGVFSRLLPVKTIIWSSELSQLSVVAMTFVGGSVAMKRGALVNLSIFVDKLKGKAYLIFTIFARLFVVAFFLFFIAEGINYIPVYAKYNATTLPISLQWPVILMTLGGIFMLIHCLVDILNDVYRLCGGDPDSLLPIGPAANASCGEEG